MEVYNVGWKLTLFVQNCVKRMALETEVLRFLFWLSGPETFRDL